MGVSFMIYTKSYCMRHWLYAIPLLWKIVLFVHYEFGGGEFLPKGSALMVGLSKFCKNCSSHSIFGAPFFFLPSQQTHGRGSRWAQLPWRFSGFLSFLKHSQNWYSQSPGLQEGFLSSRNLDVKQESAATHLDDRVEIICFVINIWHWSSSCREGNNTAWKRGFRQHRILLTPLHKGHICIQILVWWLKGALHNPVKETVLLDDTWAASSWAPPWTLLTSSVCTGWGPHCASHGTDGEEVALGEERGSPLPQLLPSWTNDSHSGNSQHLEADPQGPHAVVERGRVAPPEQQRGVIRSTRMSTSPGVGWARPGCRPQTESPAPEWKFCFCFVLSRLGKVHSTRRAGCRAQAPAWHQGF